MENRDYEELRRLMALAKSQHDGSGYSFLDEALESIGQKPLVPKARPRVYQGAVAKSVAASSMAVPKAFVPSVGGAMTDASKRRLDDSGWQPVDHEFEDESYAVVGDLTSPAEIAAFMDAHHVPVPFVNESLVFETPKTTSWYPELDFSDVDARVPLPKRFQTVEQWSRVEVDLPKYKGYGETFVSLVRGAYGGDAGKISYLSFIMGKFSRWYTPEPESQAPDLAGFLMHIKFKPPPLKARGYVPRLADP